MLPLILALRTRTSYMMVWLMKHFRWHDGVRATHFIYRKWPYQEKLSKELWNLCYMPLSRRSSKKVIEGNQSPLSLFIEITDHFHYNSTPKIPIEMYQRKAYLWRFLALFKLGPYDLLFLNIYSGSEWFFCKAWRGITSKFKCPRNVRDVMIGQLA